MSEHREGEDRVRLRLINAPEVRALLPMAQCIERMDHAMRLVTDPRTRQPLRSMLPVPSGAGVLGLMPGFIPDPPALGVKVISVFPGNFGTRYGSHQGLVLLFGVEHGEPLALIDARAITAIRTAAASAVATRALARTDARTLGLCGYGEQARTHLEALLAVRPFDRVRVWGRDPARRSAFAASAARRHGIDVQAVASPDAMAGTDVVCTLTAATEPYYRAQWLRPGQHLNVVGSGVPSTAEVDEQTVARARFFVDYRDSALALAGEFRRAQAAGLVGESHMLGSIGEVLGGVVRGRTGPDDVTLFKSLGMAAEDLVTCEFVLREAQRLGVGQEVPW